MTHDIFGTDSVDGIQVQHLLQEVKQIGVKLKLTRDGLKYRGQILNQIFLLQNHFEHLVIVSIINV